MVGDFAIAYYGIIIALGMMGGVLAVFGAILMLILFFAFAFAVASYVLQGISLYTIAERRGLQHKWAAWVPVANNWLLGSIADQYQYVAKGQIKNRRKVLLGVNIAAIAVYFAGYVIGPVIVLLSGSAVASLVVTLSKLAYGVVLVVWAVFYYIALYDLYQSCQPSNAVMYLVLSIVISVTLPFFVFACRKKDLGMPPRKQTLQERVEEMMQTREESAEVSAEEPAAGDDAFGDPSAAEETNGETTEEPAEETTDEKPSP